jgi:hypothetical protein
MHQQPIQVKLLFLFWEFGFGTLFGNFLRFFSFPNDSFSLHFLPVGI